MSYCRCCTWMRCRLLLRPGSPHLLLRCAFLSFCPYRLLCQIEMQRVAACRQPHLLAAAGVTAVGNLSILRNEVPENFGPTIALCSSVACPCTQASQCRGQELFWRHHLPGTQQ